MRFRENKEEIIRRAVFALLILFTGMLQNTRGLFPTFFGAAPLLLIPLTVSIAMFENDMGGLFMGLISGVVWDFCSVRADGFYPIILVITGYACSFLIARYMRNNFVTAIVYTLISSFICVTLYWLIFVLPLGTQGAGRLYAKLYLVSAVYTTVLSPLYYFFVRFLALKFRKEETQAEDEKA